MRKRLARLESPKGGADPEPEVGKTAREIREIDRKISELRVEIAETEASMTPEEIARSHAEADAFMESLEGLSLDEQIAALEAEIAEEENAT